MFLLNTVPARAKAIGAHGTACMQTASLRTHRGFDKCFKTLRDIAAQGAPSFDGKVQWFRPGRGALNEQITSTKRGDLGHSYYQAAKGSRSAGSMSSELKP